MASNYTKKCLTYYAKADGEGYPIPGTLQGYNPYEQLPCDSICDLIKIDPTQVQPNGTKPCIHSENLRFFYRIVPFSNPRQVQPNSLIAAYQEPKSPNDCWWAEWHKYCAI